MWTFISSKDDITNAPFKDEIFDRIIAVSTIEHIGFDKHEQSKLSDGDLITMKEIRRILKEIRMS